MRLIITALLMLTSINASASSISNNLWGEWLYVDEIIYEGEDDGGRVYVMFEKPVTVSHCSQDSSNGQYVRVYGNTKKGEQFTSALLTSIAAKRQARPALSSYTCDDLGRPVLEGLRIGH
ncbi:hypothetical protein [Photobacterium gaetbulicola]|uniref:hypothetical protein n=1 Tax=Photobacterium gaetbulicola TaxID=1295392 RepID=UPI0011B276A9|nr:hypothetical protein [Photobacterium gaetbulicola]